MARAHVAGVYNSNAHSVWISGCKEQETHLFGSRVESRLHRIVPWIRRGVELDNLGVGSELGNRLVE